MDRDTMTSKGCSHCLSLKVYISAAFDLVIGISTMACSRYHVFMSVGQSARPFVFRTSEDRSTTLEEGAFTGVFGGPDKTMSNRASNCQHLLSSTADVIVVSLHIKCIIAMDP